MTPHFAPTVRGSGPGLLLAHGAGGGVEGDFGSILDDLARHRTVIGADYPGAGHTPRSAVPLTLDLLADGLAAAAENAGVQTFSVLGYSLGTAVAIRVATRYPDRVDGLILTSGLAHADNHVRLVVDVWRHLLDGDRTILGKFLTLLASGDAFLAGLTPAELGSTVDDSAAVVPTGSADHACLVAELDVRAELSSIAVPTLVIATTADSLIPTRLSRDLADGLPSAEFVEIDAGHNIGVEARDEWLSAIVGWLSRR